MKAAVKAIIDGKGELGVRIVQLVRLLREGEPVIMSKRAADLWTAAYLALLRAVEIVIASGLRILGVSAPEEMR